MNICLDCGFVFDDDEIGTYGDRHPYGNGYATETHDCCPHCKGYFEEAVRCEICGEWEAEERLTSGVCEDCAISYRRDYEVLEKFSEEAKDTVDVSCLITSVLSNAEIETILLRYIEEHDIDCESFINDNFEEFCEFLMCEGGEK